MNDMKIEKAIDILKEKLKQWEIYKNINFKTPIEKEIARENQAIETVQMSKVIGETQI